MAKLNGSLLAFVIALVASSAPAQQPRPVFEQPRLGEAAGNMYVKSKPRRGTFFVVLWQPNPHRADGALIPVRWDVGEKTGFRPRGPLERHQMGMRDAPGSTAVQIDGDTVGAYLNSRELVKGAAYHKHMITPAYEFPPGQQIAPFSREQSALTCTLQLQVPTAVDGAGPKSAAYVVLDLMFAREDGVRLTYNGVLFYFRPEDTPAERIGFDPVVKIVVVLTPIKQDAKWNTFVSGSEPMQGATWTGWKTFRFKITHSNFLAALKAVSQKHRTTTWGEDPSQWKLTMIHLNAEILYETAPAELGWSMRRLRCTTAE